MNKVLDLRRGECLTRNSLLYTFDREANEIACFETKEEAVRALKAFVAFITRFGINKPRVLVNFFEVIEDTNE